MNKLKIFNGYNPVKPKGVDFDIPLPANLFEKWNPNLRINPKNKTDNTIEILDVIGMDFFGDGITTKSISNQMKNFDKNSPITVLINSPGGDLFEGIGIYNMLMEHEGEITVKILGLAASAASLIAMAATPGKSYIAKSAFIMIHNAWTGIRGDRNILREVADHLEPFDSTIAEIYLDRSKISSKKEISQMMDTEKWFNGNDSVDNGLSDNILEDNQIDMKAELPEKILALRKIENLCKSAGMPRREAKEFLKSLNLGKPGATIEESKTQDALDYSELLSNIENLSNQIN